MKNSEIIDHHTIIRDTVGYDAIKNIDIFDLPSVMEFLKIIYNYERMKRQLNEN